MLKENTENITTDDYYLAAMTPSLLSFEITNNYNDIIK